MNQEIAGVDEMARFYKLHRPATDIAIPEATALLQSGDALLAEGDYQRAAAQYQQVLASDPRSVVAHNNLGVAYKRQNLLNEAGIAFQQAVSLQTNFVEAYVNLGDTLRLMERLQESEMVLRAALDIDADCAEAHNNLGILLRRRGELDQAAQSFQRALALRPDYADAAHNLGNLEAARGCSQQAATNFQRAVISANSADAHNSLALLYQREGRWSEAESEFQHALDLDSHHIHAWINFGVLRQCQGRIADAQHHYRRALEIEPRFAQAHSNLLISLGYDPQIDLEELHAEHLRWEAQQTKHLSRRTKHDNDPDPQRRLKIGYVSPDFREHPVAHCIEPILRSHNRRNVSVICYSDAPREDEVTARLRELSDVWRNSSTASDEELDRIIQRDEIDILIDLSGHTAGNRLLVFARKPAPIQFSFLGYGNTSGLSAIDYRITDPACDSVDEPSYYAEQLIWLPEGHFSYQPPNSVEEVQPPPALARKFVTFGSFNNLAKIGPEVISLWARILAEIPNSRLLLKNGTFADQATCDRFLTQFAERGIAAERIELRGYSAEKDAHLADYHDVDVALDPFPYTGATTTCEALWMGVPVVTLRGKNYVGRLSASILTYSGCPYLIADSPKRYVSTAIGLASDIGQLEELRSKLRKQLTESTLCNGKVATALEAEYRRAWQEYCQTKD